MLSVGRCGVARLQMKVGHMDGMHCFIDSTSILIKIKAVLLYNFRTVYFGPLNVRFMLDNLALGQDYFLVLVFSIFTISPSVHHTFLLLTIILPGQVYSYTCIFTEYSSLL